MKTVDMAVQRFRTSVDNAATICRYGGNLPKPRTDGRTIMSCVLGVS
jgi:hypothetical protein